MVRKGNVEAAYKYIMDNDTAYLLVNWHVEGASGIRRLASEVRIMFEIFGLETTFKAFKKVIQEQNEFVELRPEERYDYREYIGKTAGEFARKVKQWSVYKGKREARLPSYLGY